VKGPCFQFGLGSRDYFVFGASEAKTVEAIEVIEVLAFVIDGEGLLFEVFRIVAFKADDIVFEEELVIIRGHGCRNAVLFFEKKSAEIA